MSVTTGRSETLRGKILESIHSTATAAHLGTRKTPKKLRTRFYWPRHFKDSSVFGSSCPVRQQRNSPNKKHRHSLVNGPTCLLFARIGFDFLERRPV